jgi:hypothetical protein
MNGDTDWKARAETAETTLVRIRTMDRQTVGVYDATGRRHDFVVVSAYELDRVLGPAEMPEISIS